MAAQAVLGLDIGFHSIKAVELARVNKTIQLVSLGSIPTPPRGLLSETTVDEKAMVDTILKLLHDMKATSKIVNTSLPESQVYTRVIEVPKLSEKELASSIQWEAEQYIPLPISQVNLDYAVLGGEDNNSMHVLLVAAPRKIIDKYSRILAEAGVSLASVETDAIAILRVIPKEVPESANLLLINIGANASDICIVRKRILTFVRTVPIGGDSFTRAISEELGFNPAQSEEYKRTYGLDKEKLEGKVFASIQPVFHTIIEEIKKIQAFFRDHYANEELSSAIVYGGSARLPGLISYIAGETGVDLQVSNPFEDIEVHPSIKQQIEANSPSFAVSVLSLIHI